MKFFFIILFAALASQAQDDAKIVFRDKDSSITLAFETGNLYLEPDKPTKFKVSLQNIEEKAAIVGAGIRVIHSRENNPDSFFCTVTVDLKNVIDGNYKIIIRYKIRGEKKMKFHTFLIPVKTR